MESIKIGLDMDEKIDELKRTVDQNPNVELGFYDELAFLYEYLYSREYDHEGQTHILADHNEGPATILDVGCGAGYLIDSMLKKFDSANIDGIELHEGMANLAKEKFQESERVNIKQQNIFDTSVKEKYDIITAFGVNPHFTETQHSSFFEKMADLLTDEGVLVFDYKNPSYEENGRYNDWEGQTDSYNIVSRFVTVYKEGQSYYTCSYEFEHKDTGENFYAGCLFEVYFHDPDRLRDQLQKAGLEVLSHYTENVDQSGVFVVQLSS